MYHTTIILNNLIFNCLMKLIIVMKIKKLKWYHLINNIINKCTLKEIVCNKL